MGSNGSSGEGRVKIGSAATATVRWAAVDLGAVLEEIRRRQDLAPLAAVALGRAMAGAVLLLHLSARACRRLTLVVSGDGPLGRVSVDVDADGAVRGLVGDPRAELPPEPDGKLRIAAAVGRGTLKVLRELADGSIFESQVELVSGEIGLDLAHFLEQSEQTASAVLVGVLAGPEGIRAAGGMIVEAMPDATDEVLGRLETNLAVSGGASRWLDHGGVGALTEVVLAGLPQEVHERKPVRFQCHCSREALRDRLSTLPAADRADLAAGDGLVEAECAWCGTRYRFAIAELTPQ